MLFFFSPQHPFFKELSKKSHRAASWFAAENDPGREAWWAAWRECSDFQIPPNFLNDCTALEIKHLQGKRRKKRTTDTSRCQFS